MQETAHAAFRDLGAEGTPYVLAQLARRREWNRAQMRGLIHLLGQMGDKSVAPMLARVLFGEYPLSPRRWSKQAFLYLLLPVLAPVLCVIWWLDGVPGMGFSQAWLIGLIAGGLLYSLIAVFALLPICSVKLAGEQSEIALTALYSLENLQDKKAIPSLIVIATSARAQLREAARRVLTRMLPLLASEDYGIFNESTCRRLSRLLQEGDRKLTLAILRSLEFVGGGAMAQPVERLLRQEFTGEIREEAERVLPVLQARQAQERASSHLLRAASTPEILQDTLLRPAQNRPETAPEQLLRPMD